MPVSICLRPSVHTHTHTHHHLSVVTSAQTQFICLDPSIHAHLFPVLSFPIYIILDVHVCICPSIHLVCLLSVDMQALQLSSFAFCRHSSFIIIYVHVPP